MKDYQLHYIRLTPHHYLNKYNVTETVNKSPLPRTLDEHYLMMEMMQIINHDDAELVVFIKPNVELLL